MIYVIYLAGGVEGIKDYPELLEHVGRYVLYYDPWRTPTGEQWLWTTDDEDKAVGFDSMQKAQEFWSTSIGVRPDGKADRPLSIYHVQIIQKGEEPIPGEWLTV